MSLDPNTMAIVRDIARKVAAVKIPTGRMKSHLRMPGDRKSVHRGEGDDFDGHELYAAGDDPRTIDWNATAMTAGQQMLIALFKEETQIKGTIVCDVSTSMDFGTRRATKRRLAAELAACAVRSLSLTHDPVGLVTYSRSGVERRVRAAPSASMMLPVISHVITSVQTERPGGHGLAKALAQAPRTPGIVFVISDFINVTDEDWQALRNAGKRHRLFAMFVNDLRERELPNPGWLPMLYALRDGNGNEREIWLTRAACREHAARFAKRQAETLARLKDCRASAVTVGTDEDDQAVVRVLNFLRMPTVM